MRPDIGGPGIEVAVRTIRHPEVVERPADHEGVFTFDLAMGVNGSAFPHPAAALHTANGRSSPFTERKMRATRFRELDIDASEMQ
jgi:hypothetical protein